MTIDEIKQLIQLAQETGVAELEVQRGENRVRIRLAGVSADYVVPAGGAPAQGSRGHVGDAPTDPGDERYTEENLELVKSPIVGTYYDAPSPGSDPFVKVGDVVKKGQILCIIESMKLMNEIESEVSGAIVAKLVENGNAVEYGEALFSVRPS